MIAPRWPDKDPDDVLDYSVDWSAPLALDADAISSSSWIVPSGLTRLSDTWNQTATVIWLSGGTAGESYLLTNRIVTTGGRTRDQSVQLPVNNN